MALIAIAADKGAPGVTTASVALAAVWPRPVLLAECDTAGGDLVYRLPAADGSRLDPRRGLLSLAVAARRGLQPHQVWEHTQKLHGGLDILTGVSNAEQGSGLELLWGSVGRLLAAVPEADVIADCGRIGVDGPVYDLLAQASSVVLLTRATLGEVIRLRSRADAIVTALGKRGRAGRSLDVVVVADYKNFSSATAEVGQALRQGRAPARIVGGLAHEPKSAEQLRGEWSGKLDKSMFIRTARAIAGDLLAGLPEPAPAGDGQEGVPGRDGQRNPTAPADRPAPARSAPSHPQGSSQHASQAAPQAARPSYPAVPPAEPTRPLPMPPGPPASRRPGAAPAEPTPRRPASDPIPRRPAPEPAPRRPAPEPSPRRPAPEPAPRRPGPDRAGPSYPAPSRSQPPPGPAPGPQAPPAPPVHHSGPRESRYTLPSWTADELPAPMSAPPGPAPADEPGSPGSRGRHASTPATPRAEADEASRVRER
ncbi:MAG TPA: hypothetical protein VFE59_11725 [Trebonia sp.]|nr:hypothetical protein [Trebonia sp.]